jgi:prepilin peptidase CpaA
MTTGELLQFVPMVVLLAWAAAIDVRCRRIPNWLTGALVASGLAQSALPYWSLTPGQAMGGLAAGFGLTFLLFVLGGMCGGDVKLFAGIGAWVGAVLVVKIFAVEAVIGMLIVVAQGLCRRRMGALVRNSTVLLVNAAVRGDLSCPEEPSPSGDAERHLPYAVPALLATLAVLWAGRRWM